MPSILRLDKGTETGTLTTMHAFLRSHHKDMDPVETVIYGPSTSSQVSMVFGVTMVFSQFSQKAVRRFA